MADPSDDSTETIAEVVMAEDVPVTVLTADVTRVVEVAPAEAGPVPAMLAPEADAAAFAADEQ
jgi:hypothetical protein